MNEPVDPEGNELRAISELVDFDAKDVLEIGCGEGRLVRRYATRVASVIGIDSVESDIRDAETRTAASLQSRVRFQVADALSVQFDAAAFDVVVLGRSI